jgi:penicillin-binding protein 1C
MRHLKRAILFLVSAVAVFALLSALFPLPPLKPYSLVIEDRNGEFVHAFLAPDGAWRLKTHPDEIPERLRQILIQREDRFFYYHPGVNPFSMVRALVQNATSGKRVSGASTITMQIARMLEPKERSYLNKLIEVFRAFQLELKYSKDELLEIYLSMVPLGGNIEGLRSAALLYYQTPLERLNIAQQFDLILIPSNPNALRPDRNPERLYTERVRQAAKWIEEGLLSREDSTVIWHMTAGAGRQTPARHAPHLALRVRGMAKGQTEITSSLDLRMQRTVERLLSNHLLGLKERGINNGAVVVLDNRTREVLAYVGSGDFDDVTSHGQVNGARALRSPGSTLKPLLYALRMDQGELTPKSRLLDTPFDAEGFQAENYDGTYSGLVYADEALRRSLNVPMIRVLKTTGMQPFLELLDNSGFASLRPQQPRLGLSLILGGCGVTLEELTAAYAAFPNGGTYLPPSFTKTGDAPAKGREAFSPGAAFMVTEILSGLNRPDLPNNFESARNLPRIAFKTGTSYGRRDAWAIGYSADHTVGVWIGNANNMGNPDIVGSRCAAPLLVDVLNAISRRHTKTIMQLPKDVSMRVVCARSGHVPTPQCDHVIEDYYSVTLSTHHRCAVDREYFVSADRRWSYCLSCLGNHVYTAQTIADYPPELLSFWQKSGKAFAVAPPHNPACTRVFAGDGPTIISPSQDMTYYVLDASQKMTLQASAPLDVRELVWYVNDRFHGRNSTGGKVFITLPAGSHTVSCVDDRGRMSTVRFEVKRVL